MWRRFYLIYHDHVCRLIEFFTMIEDPAGVNCFALRGDNSEGAVMPVRRLPDVSSSAGMCRGLLAGLFGLALLPGAALGADMPDIGFAPPPLVQEFGSNWYLRGDIGYTWQSGGMTGDAILADYSETPPGPIDPFYGTDFGGGSLDDTWVIGGGFGVRASEWLRFDATLDYRSKATMTSGGLFSIFDENQLPPEWTEPRADFAMLSTDVSTTLLLANAYFDLGTWNGFTPYVGAGIGAGYVDAGELNIANVGTAELGSKWSFAWALMAGASFEVGPGWLIDVGYRYSSISGVNFASTVAGPEGYGELGTINVNVGDIDTQEVRVGMRYMID